MVAGRWGWGEGGRGVHEPGYGSGAWRYRSAGRECCWVAPLCASFRAAFVFSEAPRADSPPRQLSQLPALGPGQRPELLTFYHAPSVGPLASGEPHHVPCWGDPVHGFSFGSI